MLFLIHVLIFITVLELSSAYIVRHSRNLAIRMPTLLKCATDSSAMTIDEIKSELDLRGVDYSECVSKKELLDVLRESRSTGKANPEILKKFNQMRDLDDNFGDVLNSDIAQDVAAKDGTLPGGMSPELMKTLASDKEIVKMLRDPKMQDIMQAVMTGGPQALQKYLSDPDALLLLGRLNNAIARSTKSE